MHLVESFALDTGLKIDKPHIYEKFIPTSFKGEYITLQPFGKYDSRKYDHWPDVVEILRPHIGDLQIIQLIFQVKQYFHR